MKTIKEIFYKIFSSMTIGYTWFTLSMLGVVLTYDNTAYSIQLWFAISCLVSLIACGLGTGITHTTTNMRMHGMEYHTHTTDDSAYSIGILYGFTWSFILLILYWIGDLGLGIINVTPMWYLPIVVFGIPAMLGIEWYSIVTKRKNIL